MPCEICENYTAIGSKNTFLHKTLNCDECGYQHHQVVVGIYVGMIDYFHVFIFDRPFYCPNCGVKSRRFYLPCGDTQYFDMNTISISNEEYR
jgi:hypothetical protein